MADHDDLLARHREQWSGKQHHGLNFGDLNTLIELQAEQLEAERKARERAEKFAAEETLRCLDAEAKLDAERKAREEAERQGLNLMQEVLEQTERAERAEAENAALRHDLSHSVATSAELATESSKEPLYVRLAVAQVASCQCNTKSPDVDLHHMSCPYRLYQESAVRIANLAAENARLRAAFEKPMATVATVEGMGTKAVKIKWLGGFPDIGMPLFTKPATLANEKE